MSESDALIAAIAADPAQDLPRLVYADWLDERGDSVRAAAIRDHVQLAKSPNDSPLRTRVADALKTNLTDWLRSACEAFGQPVAWKSDRRLGSAFRVELGPPSAIPALQNAEFQRGFLERAHLDFDRIAGATNLERFLREHPVTRLSLQFTGRKSTWNELAGPALNRIRRLDLPHLLGANPASAIFASPHWTNLTSLRLTANESARSLVQSPLAKRLIRLETVFRPEFLIPLTDFPLDDRLREFRLQLSGDFLPSAPEWGNLSRVAFRPTLHHLDVSNCGMDDAGLSAFARGETWLRLKSLNLSENPFTDVGWRDFCRGWRTPELTHLAVRKTRMTGAGLETVAKSAMMEHLKVLDLRGYPIGDGFREIVSAARGRNLELLKVTGSEKAKLALANFAARTGSRLRIE